MMKKILSVILCSALILTLAACGKSEVKKEVNSTNIVKEEPKEEPKEVKIDEIKSREVILYFSDDQALYLVPEKRNIEKPTAKSIVMELVKGPSIENTSAGTLYGTLPVDLQILDVQVKENIAYVDFKGDIGEKMQGGSAAEGMALFSIINTLVLDKQLGITKVQFLVEGQKVETIAGHYNVSQPMSEDKEMIKK
jgi:germination protein M